jgi:hypothetical protein
MPIKQLTPMQEVRKYLNDSIERKTEVLIRITCYSGEAGLIVARINGSYFDRTGNLRSSIGYIVAKDGQIVETSGFTQVPPKQSQQGDKFDGAKQGEDFARQIIKKYPQGIALVESAGMNYSGYVSAKGYDVLDSAQAETKRVFLQLLKQHGFLRK